MLNEEKIRLMTDLAAFEKKNGRRMRGVTGHFKSDYVSRYLMRGFLSYTICFSVLLLFLMMINMDTFFSTIGLEAFVSFAKRAAVLYAITLVAYEVLVSVIYGRRYDTETRKLRMYTVKLKHLDKQYDYQSRTRELNREGRRV